MDPRSPSHGNSRVTPCACQAYVRAADNRPLLKRLIFENNSEGFEKLLVHEEAIRGRHTLSKVVFGLEPTADDHIPPAEYLLKKGHMVEPWPLRGILVTIR